MTARFFISPVIGDGKTLETAFRLKVSDYDVPHPRRRKYLLPTGLDGKPLFPWGICMVDTSDHSFLLADLDITAMPAIAIASKLTGVQRNDLITKLGILGVNTSSINTNSTLRECLVLLAKHLDLNVAEKFIDG